VFTVRYGLSTKTDTFRLVFVTEVESVYSEVWFESLYKTDTFRLVFITELVSFYSAVRTESLHRAFRKSPCT
jgi:hypothetical protein